MLAHNLESVIADSIREVGLALEKLVEGYEIMIVDDGSMDDTYQKAMSLASSSSCSLA